VRAAPIPGALGTTAAVPALRPRGPPQKMPVGRFRVETSCMDRLSQLTAFVETVRAGSMSAAGRRLELPRATVSRHIQALEDWLGAQLLVRTTRALRLTEAGAAYFDTAREVLDALAAAEERVRDSQGRASGTLRVNAPMSFGVRVLGRLLPAFLRRHPALEVQLALSDALVDPVRGGFDLTLRIARLPDSSLVARRLAPVPRAMVAAPAYLAGRGVPAHPGELAEHACLHYGYLQSGTAWVFTRGEETFRVGVSGPLCANNGEVLADAALAGIGIALLPEFIVGEALADGRLQRVLADWQAPGIALHAMYPATRRLPLKTRRFIDFLADQLGEKGVR
jgi:DNA-binding transcriptional LysR family regulator